MNDRDRLVSAVSFMQDRLNDTINYSDREIVKQILDYLLKNDEIESCVDNPEKIKFKQKNKKVELSLQRFVRRQLEIDNFKLPDYSLEYLGKQLAIHTAPDEYINSKVKILEGDDIVDFYSKGAHSCMSGSSSKNVIIYALNSDKVKLATFGKYRALLFTLDDGTKYIESIYNNDNSNQYDLLVKFGRINGYKTKDDIKQKTKFLTLVHNGVFPYMDTFYIGKFDEDKIILSNCNFKGNNIDLDSTEGLYSVFSACYFCFKDKNLDFDLKSIGVDDKCCYECYRKYLTLCKACDKVIVKSDAVVCKDKYYCKDCCELRKNMILVNEIKSPKMILFF
jgi:hypothetical protein